MFRPQKQTTQATHLAAPVGGWNASSPISGMPATDCIFLYNLIPFQYGLRTRLGYTVRATGIVDSLAAAAEVRTMLAFTGSKVDGTSDRLFAASTEGINRIDNVTSGGAVGAKVFTFATEDASSGHGIAAAFSNSAGHFLAYCDEANGYHIYDETYGAWRVVKATAATTPWANASYSVGDRVITGGNSYTCASAGTSTAAPTTTGVGITNGGTATWDFDWVVTGADPTKFRHVMSWKNRLWFTYEDSATAYYLPVNSIAGAVQPIYFGPRFRAGGALVGLWSRTLDGGAGVDDMLVGISTSGDIVVYQGSDPASTATFGLRGVWFVGPVPAGRRIASDFGGDLFILSMTGCVPLSKLVAGGLIRDPNLYATQKIANLFNVLMSERQSLSGWELRIHPQDNTLVINLPPVPPLYTPEQLTMSLATQGWARHQGVPMTCMESWHGLLYFGTDDGRVCINQGGTDADSIGTASNGGIGWSLLTAYTTAGAPNQKRVQMVRPHFVVTDTKPSYAVVARYDFDIDDPTVQAQISPVSASAWDVGLWDTALWAGGVGNERRLVGTWGMGTNVALYLSGTSTTTTTLAGFDILIDQGGLL